MEFGTINILAVVVSAVAAMVVGFIWYSPPLFEKAWLEEIGRTREQLEGDSPLKYLVAFVGSLLMAYILARLLDIVGGPSLDLGILMAIVVWVAFVAATSAVNFAFAGRPVRLWLIENGSHLLTLLVMGVILGVWV
ncbi:MAG: hypothetical protein BMS9Abin28_1702 [Anaerolineae bacterium]|nr:MAG: hypothetical protein BMS9Abin28_1702 [Anaerolineae bacterium]